MSDIPFNIAEIVAHLIANAYGDRFSVVKLPDGALLSHNGEHVLITVKRAEIVATQGHSQT